MREWRKKEPECVFGHVCLCMHIRVVCTIHTKHTPKGKVCVCVCVCACMCKKDNIVAYSVVSPSETKSIIIWFIRNINSKSGDPPA